MDRREFIASTAAACTALVLPSLADAAYPAPICFPASAVHLFSEAGLYEISADVETDPDAVLPARIELVRHDGLRLATEDVPTGPNHGWFTVTSRWRFEQGEGVALRLQGPSMKVESCYATRLPDSLEAEPYGVYVRDPDRRRAAQRARDFATMMDQTLYLGRDFRTGEHLALSGDAGVVPFRDRHYGEAPIVPRGDPWEARQIEEGRAPWL